MVFEGFGKTGLLLDADLDAAGNGVQCGQHLAPKPGLAVGQLFDALDDFFVVQAAADFDARQPYHPFTGEGVQRTIDQQTQSVFAGQLKDRSSAGLILLQHGTRFKQIERQLDQLEVVVVSDGLSDGQHAVQRGEFRIVRIRRKRIGADAVEPDAPPGYLGFQENESLFDTPIVFPVGGFPPHPLLVGPPQIILRVVQQVAVDGLQIQALQRTADLVLQKIRMNAMAQSLGVIYDLFKWVALGLALPSERFVGALDIAAFGNHHHLLPSYPTLFDQLSEDFANQLFRPAIGIIGGGVDEVDAAGEGVAKRCGMHRHTAGDPIAAESGGTDGQLRSAERMEGRIRM